MPYSILKVSLIKLLAISATINLVKGLLSLLLRIIL